MTSNKDLKMRWNLLANKLTDGNKGDLAKAIDMTPQSFSKYSIGRTRPGFKILSRLYFIGVNINWFLMGEGQPLRDDTPDTRPQNSTKRLDITAGKAPVTINITINNPSKTEQNDQ